jgi:hypothetical protein
LYSANPHPILYSPKHHGKKELAMTSARISLASACVFFSLTGLANAGIAYDKPMCDPIYTIQHNTLDNGGDRVFAIPCENELKAQAATITPPKHVIPAERPQYEPISVQGSMATMFAPSEESDDAVMEEDAIVYLSEAVAKHKIVVVVMDSRKSCRKVEQAGLQCGSVDEVTIGAREMMVSTFGPITNLAALGMRFAD